MAKMTKEQIKEMQESVMAGLLQLYPELKDEPGIYILTRKDQYDIKYCYVGQSKIVLSRMIQHLLGNKQQIDMALSFRGLYDAVKCQYGYHLGVKYCDEADLDRLERKYILEYARCGYQVLNRTFGGQGKGKELFGDKKPASDFTKGIAEGRKGMAQEVSEILEDLQIDGDEVLQERLSELLTEKEDNMTFDISI